MKARRFALLAAMLLGLPLPVAWPQDASSPSSTSAASVAAPAASAPAFSQFRAYVGLGLDEMTAAMYEAAGTYFDWGKGRGPGGGMLISFVDPDSEAFGKGITWGDVLVGVDWGSGGAQGVGKMGDFELAMTQLAPGAQATLLLFRSGQSLSVQVTTTGWPPTAIKNWPERGGKGVYYFPWLKDRQGLIDYRVTQCQIRYRSDGDPLALKDLAETYFFTDRHREANAAYAAYLKANPAASNAHYPALYAMAHAAREDRQWKASRQAAEQALTANPSSYLAQYELARALFGLGQKAGALKCIENAMALLPPDQPNLRASLELWRKEIQSAPDPTPEPERDPNERLESPPPEDYAGSDHATMELEADATPSHVANEIEIEQGHPADAGSKAPSHSAKKAATPAALGALPPDVRPEDLEVVSEQELAPTPKPGKAMKSPGRTARPTPVETPRPAMGANTDPALARVLSENADVSSILPGNLEVVGDDELGTPKAGPPPPRPSNPAAMTARPPGPESAAAPAGLPDWIKGAPPGKSVPGSDDAAVVSVAPPQLGGAGADAPAVVGPKPAGGQIAAGAGKAVSVEAAVASLSVAPPRLDTAAGGAAKPGAATMAPPAPESTPSTGGWGLPAMIETPRPAPTRTPAPTPQATAFPVPKPAQPAVAKSPSPDIEDSQPTPDPNREPLPSNLKFSIKSIGTLMPVYTGGQIVVVVNYAVEGLAPGQGVEVQESIRMIKKDKTLQTKTAAHRREGGKAVLNVVFPIPPNATPGSYELEAALRAGPVMTKKRSSLDVGKGSR